MISSVFSLKEANGIPDYLVSNPETRLEENYYFNSSLDFLLECQNELLSCRKDFYKTVLESGDENPYIINEAFNDILQRVKEIIKKILAYIESMVKRFVTSLNKFVSSDKYIIKMKKEIDKFPKDESFKISGYNYTFDDNIPIVDITGLDISEVEIAIRNLENSDDVSIRINELTTVLNSFTSEEKITEARSQILGAMNDIPDASFANEVFCIYRDGKSSEFDIEIKKADVTKAMNDYEGYKNKIKEVNSLKSNISAKYKTLETKVDNIIKSDIKPKIDGSSLDQKKRYVLNNTITTLINDLVSFIQRVANYHTMAFAGKLDAYNSSMIQDRNILYKALNIVQKDINNTKIMENYDSYDYTRDGIYKGYITERYYMNKEHQRFVEECLALSESNIPELKTIHEDLKMDKKGKFEKLKQLIKEIFQKFLMKMNKFIVNDKDFLAKYKDIILTKKIPEYALNNMPDYEAGIKNIKAHKLKKLDIKNILSKTEADIQKDMLPAFDGNDFTEFAKRYFLSNNTPNREKVQSTTLNMAEIYAFCIGAPAAIKVLENDQKEFAAAADAAKNEVLKTIPANESVNIYGEKYYYSSIYEGFINEDDQPAAQNGEAKSDSNLKLDVPIPDNKAKENNNLDEKVKSDDQGKDPEKQAKENKGSDAKKVEETANWYLNTLRTICTAKITAFQKIYSEYMKILRYHVQQATGSMGTASKFTEDDTKEIKSAMQDYLKGDDAAKKSATEKIISIYKSKNMVIDAHDVQILVNKNAKSLG